MAVDHPNTKALLHMDGANNSTTFTDESGKTWTANGNAKIVTAQSVFGGASAYFDGTGDWIDTPDNADFDIAAGDFGVDFRLKRTGNLTRQIICGQFDSGGTGSGISLIVEITAANKIEANIVKTGPVGYTVTANSTIDTNFHHIYFARYSNTLYLAIDGTFQTDTADVTGVTAINSTTKFSIGRGGELASSYLNGYVDEFRFMKGYAPWTGNFTPPTSAYAPSGRPAQVIAFF